MLRRFVPIFAVALAALGPLAFVSACSDPPTRPPPASDGTAGAPLPIGGGGSEGGAADAAGGDAGTDASACNDLALSGQVIDRIGINGEPPVSTGGVIANAVYELTTYSVYVGAGGVAGPTGITARGNVRISGGRIDDVFEIGGSGKTPTIARSGSSFAASSATFATTEICPTTGAGRQRQFTATDSSLILTDLTTKEAFTFTRR